MDDLGAVRPGDKLYVSTGRSYDRSFIVTVDRLTPSGRVVCGQYTFHPDGRLYGETNHGWGRTRAVRAEQKHFDGLEVQRLAEELRRTDWHRQPLAILRSVTATLSAQGIEAGTGETRQGLDPKGESPVAEGHAPLPSSGVDSPSSDGEG